MKPSVTILSKARTKLVLTEPFYATVVLSMTQVLCKEVHGRPLWLAATDGTHLYVNPENFEKLPLLEAVGVLKHEVMHVVGMHPFRGHGKQARRWNIATDSVINPIIRDEGGSLPAGVIDGSQYKGMSAEQVYNLLPPMDDTPDPNNPMDDDIVLAKDTSQSAQNAVKNMVAQAAAVAKAAGRLPESVRQALEDIFHPTIDWREALLEFLVNNTQDDYTFARPNRRFISGDNPMYLPSLAGTGAMQSLGFMADVSMSISMDDIAQALGEVVGCVNDVKPSKLVVAYCDVKVQHADFFDEPNEAAVTEKLERHGAGGTDMPAGLKWFKRNVPDCQAVIVFTDGYTPWGAAEDYPFPVLWAITTPGLVAPWGTTIHIPSVGAK